LSLEYDDKGGVCQGVISGAGEVRSHPSHATVMRQEIPKKTKKTKRITKVWRGRDSRDRDRCECRGRRQGEGMSVRCGYTQGCFRVSEEGKERD
jgi:hypothetical protein